MSKTMVARDPFARGEFERTCHGAAECDYCGQKRQRVFSYKWVSDGGHSTLARKLRMFCNLDCFRSYY